MLDWKLGLYSLISCGREWWVQQVGGRIGWLLLVSFDRSDDEISLHSLTNEVPQASEVYLLTYCNL